MLRTLTVQRHGDAKPQQWLFDDDTCYRRARELAIATGIYRTDGQDYITDFDEFAAWVRRDP
ncbi:hypothetical protein [Thauera sp. Sel9]|uniref:hypothetical protein n=1 Tax=Thauera sp. Sel9 TaxID=2974299 RepID=UPI0021E1092B|nr:hypothetical protein [Thauera sp. Sel9]MCV2216097.1 hypothetical protein [Thauera sp. Sel9]